MNKYFFTWPSSMKMDGVLVKAKSRRAAFRYLATAFSSTEASVREEGALYLILKML